MVKLSNLMDVGHLAQRLEGRYIVERRHPTLPLVIFNYTAKTQYEWAWDDVTRQCRGLIVRDDGEVAARPFPKFFSINQLAGAGIALPDEPFEVFTKEDGSLGVAYCHDDVWYIASRGSFVSEQAVEGTRMLRRMQDQHGVKLDPSLTYCFEVIYPENRIVVDYHGSHDLVLLAIFETETGRELPLDTTWYPPAMTVERHAFDSVDRLVDALETDPTFAGQEGFVLRYASGLRVKVKSSEYLHYHRLVSRLSPKRIWEHLSEGYPIERLVHGLWSAPSEWIRTRAMDLENRFREIQAYTLNEYQAALDACVTDEGISRKDFALWCQRHAREDLPLLFAYFDDTDQEDIDRMIWKRLKPRGDEVFRPETEDL
jgi:T4 RnlA family RNA ligase